MLTGEDAFAATNNQLTFELQIQIKIAATRTWRELPSKGETSFDLTSIHQSPDEHFHGFAACLVQVTGRIINDTVW